MTIAENDIRKTLGLEKAGEGLKNYSIKAGAGAGKTTLLSKRISRQIMQGTPIEEFVVITYTNAAAAELREKITSKLQKLASDTSLDREKRDNVVKALNSIELMQISTIHSFLFKILKEHSFESGIVMDAVLREAAEDTERKQSFFDKWYKEHYAEIRGIGNYDKIQAKNGNVSDHKMEIFRNMFMDLANVREKIVYDTSDHTAAINADAVRYVNNWYPKIRNFALNLAENAPLKKDGSKVLLKSATEVIENEGILRNEIGNGTIGINQAILAAKILAVIRDAVSDEKGFYGKKYPDENAIINNYFINNIVPVLPEYELEWNFEKFYDFASKSIDANLVAEYVIQMQQAYQKEIDVETQSLSNDDILYRTGKLLKEHQNVLDEVRKRYSRIYVDEFQDTTGIQAEIVSLLTGKAGSQVSADQTTALSSDNISDNKLIIVGDPKQSIYRFTGAEKAVYDNMDSQLGAMASQSGDKAESVILNSNFRSNKDIVDWVNNSFASLMPGYTNMETDWEVKEKKALHGVYRYGDISKYKTDEDINAVVQLVRDLVSMVPDESGNPKVKYFIEECHRNDDGTYGAPTYRAIEYSDIMIICKNTKKMSGYINKFAAEGIPVNVEGKFKIDNDEIIKNYLILTDYFANYKDEAKLCAAAQVLLSLDATQASDEADLKKAEGMLREMSRYLRKKVMDTSAIANFILSHEEFYVPKNDEKSKEQVKAYRIRLHQMVETCIGQNTGDLNNLVDLMKNYLESEVRKEIPLESDENAVRFMNVHQAKGLTGNIVIIADRSAGEDCRYSAFKKAGKYYPAVSYKNFSGPNDSSKSIIVPTFGYDINILRQAYTEENEESVRLQYVAATRAAHALIIMPVAADKLLPWFTDAAFHYDSCPDILRWMEDRIADENEYVTQIETDGHNHGMFTLANFQTNLASADLSKMGKIHCVSITPSMLEAKGTTGYSPADSGYIKEDRPANDIFGTVMHRVYQILFERYGRIETLAGEEREKAISRAVNQAILESADTMRKNDEPEKYKNYLQSVMTEYFDKVIVPIENDADEIYTEYEFSFFVSDVERSEFLSKFAPYFENAKISITDEIVWVNGKADLVAKRKDGTVKVWDYKSDERNGKSPEEFEAALSGKYEGQLSLYRYAIGKAFGVSNVETELIHLYR